MKINEAEYRYAIISEITGIKYFYIDHLTTILGTILRGYKLQEVSEDIVETFKEELCNEFFGGMEAEFETQESYDKWEWFKSENLVYSATDINHKPSNMLHGFYGEKDIERMKTRYNPYSDKSIKYLQLKAKL